MTSDLREQVARIIDPRLSNDDWVRNFGMYVKEAHDLALAKADAILALISPTEGVPAGWSDLSAEQRADIEAHIRGITEERDTYSLDKPPRSWRCFHCGEVFRTEEGARLHFGELPGATPVCAYEAAIERVVKQAIFDHVKVAWRRDPGGGGGYDLVERTVNEAAEAVRTSLAASPAPLPKGEDR